MAIKHLVTSGCSFSDNVDMRWPHYLAAALQAKLYNYGYGSSGNDHICNSTIYAIQKLLEKKVDSAEIKVVVMWSGITRQGHFISRDENPKFDTLLNPGYYNPANFTEFSEYAPGRFVPNSTTYDKLRSGWLVGSPHCTWENPNIKELKDLHFENFFTLEECWFKSLNYFLQLQWFCKSENISLTNLSFMKIWENPQRWSTCTHLHRLVDMSQWLFYKEEAGMFEYTRDNKLAMYDDNFHPMPESHKHYVDNFLLPRL